MSLNGLAIHGEMVIGAQIRIERMEGERENKVESWRRLEELKEYSPRGYIVWALGLN